MNDVSLIFPTRGKRTWTTLYNYPELGVGIRYAYLGKPRELGNAYSLNGFIRLPIIRRQSFFVYSLFGMGPTYISKIYDAQTNPANVSIGNHINMLVYTGLGIKVNLLKKLSLSASYSLNHYSIGTIIQPNRGLNIPVTGFHLNYNLAKENIRYPIIKPNKTSNSHEFWTFFAAGLKQTLADTGNFHLISTLSVNYSYCLGDKQKIGAGVEYFYDHTLYSEMQSEGITNYTSHDLFRPGANAAYEQVFGNMSLVLQFGRYIYTKSKSYGYYYYRVGLKYQFARHFFAMLSLKAHLPAQADFTEWGIGYVIGK